MAASASLSRRITAPLSMLLVMWVLEIIDFILPGTPLDAFGIHPRTLFGLLGIFFAPFLHGGFAHLVANTIPFFILGVLVAARRVRDFNEVFAYSMIIGGAGVWLFGMPNSNHIGASGVIFGMFGFLLARGIFERSAGAVLLSIVAAILYGGMLFSLIPMRWGVSWSGHLFGFIGGIIAAKDIPHR
jgi:membrane associated rhomboid family serine protease